MSEQNLPSGLGCSGMRLWEAAAELYEMNPGEIALLEQVCRTADELDRLESAVQGLPEFTTTGSTGQVRPHPLLQEVRAHRLLLERLTTALELPDGAGRRVWSVSETRSEGRQGSLAGVLRWILRGDCRKIGRPSRRSRVGRGLSIRMFLWSGPLFGA
jgi:hypothetical protein